jgi:hypothetical protein
MGSGSKFDKNNFFLGGGQRVFYAAGKGKANLLQAWTGPEGSRRLRLPDFKTVSTWKWQGCQPYAPAAFTRSKCFWYSFLLNASRPQKQSAAGRIMSEKHSSDTIGNRTRDLPACSAVPQTTVQLRVPYATSKWVISGHCIGPISKDQDFQERAVWPLRKGQLRCAETSLPNYQYLLRTVNCLRAEESP